MNSRPTIYPTPAAAQYPTPAAAPRSPLATLALVLGAALLLTACAGGGRGDDIDLNLPCTYDGRDFTLLERGVLALEGGQYLESLQYFQRYARIEKSALADVEARIAIAYLSIIPDSPIFNRAAASESYRRLRQSLGSTPGLHNPRLHSEILLMQVSLDALLDMQGELGRLQQTNTELRGELEQREDTIKRLRDLTLGREPEPAGLP